MKALEAEVSRFILVISRVRAAFRERGLVAGPRQIDTAGASDRIRSFGQLGFQQI